MAGVSMLSGRPPCPLLGAGMVDAAAAVAAAAALNGVTVSIAQSPTSGLTAGQTLTLTASATGLPNLPAYTVVDLMAAYRVNKNVNLQLNVANVFDKDYMSSLNNGGGRLVLGAPRAVTLMANIGF